MILALVPERDYVMWQRAAAMVPASWLIDVHPHGYKGSLLRQCSVLLKVQDDNGSLSDIAEFDLSQVRVAVSLGCQESGPLQKHRFGVFSGQFNAERYGGYSICRLPLQVAVEHNLDVELGMPPAPITGPGASSEDGKLVLWPVQPFEGLGVPVSRDERSVVAAVYEASQGDGPLWVRPGYPFLIPRSPQSFRALDTGNPVHGLLCTSVRRAGGWVVLTRFDVLMLLGHPGDVPWEQLHQIIGVQPAAALLGWLRSLAVAISSRSVQAD